MIFCSIADAFIFCLVGVAEGAGLTVPGNGEVLSAESIFETKG
jgi:hypothetical protein